MGGKREVKVFIPWLPPCWPYVGLAVAAFLYEKLQLLSGSTLLKETLILTRFWTLSVTLSLRVSKW